MRLTLFILIPLFSITALAEANATRDACLLRTLRAAESDTSIDAVKASCNKTDRKNSPLESRFYMEEINTGNQFAITPHKANYFLPVSYNKHPNEKPFVDRGSQESLENEEFLFQLSMKVAIWEKVLGHRTNLFFAYTGRFWWQAYNSDISAPFRDTNHEPELFLDFEPHWSLGSWKASSFSIGVVHQSNGRSLPLSRSWNRIYILAAAEKNDWVFALKPWYRIREDRKTDLTDPSGDDNPDIEFYMGHFEMYLGKRLGKHRVNAMIRNNLRSDNRGALQLDWTFPLWERTKLRGYIQYFNGYGESLIDYNSRTDRFSVGFIMTEWF